MFGPVVCTAVIATSAINETISAYSISAWPVSAARVDAVRRFRPEEIAKLVHVPAFHRRLNHP